MGSLLNLYCYCIPSFAFLCWKKVSKSTLCILQPILHMQPSLSFHHIVFFFFFFFSYSDYIQLQRHLNSYWSFRVEDHQNLGKPVKSMWIQHPWEKKKKRIICIFLTVSGLICSTQDFHCSIWGLSWQCAGRLSCPEACGFPVPQSGIKPTSPALGMWILNHWITREVLG